MPSNCDCVSALTLDLRPSTQSPNLGTPEDPTPPPPPTIMNSKILALSCKPTNKTLKSCNYPHAKSCEKNNNPAQKADAKFEKLNPDYLGFQKGTKKTKCTRVLLGNLVVVLEPSSKVITLAL